MIPTLRVQDRPTKSSARWMVRDGSWGLPPAPLRRRELRAPHPGPARPRGQEDRPGASGLAADAVVPQGTLRVDAALASSASKAATRARWMWPAPHRSAPSASRRPAAAPSSWRRRHPRRAQAGARSGDRRRRGLNRALGPHTAGPPTRRPSSGSARAARPMPGCALATPGIRLNVLSFGPGHRTSRPPRTLPRDGRRCGAAPHNRTLGREECRVVTSFRFPGRGAA